MPDASGVIAAVAQVRGAIRRLAYYDATDRRELREALCDHVERLCTAIAPPGAVGALAPRELAELTAVFADAHAALRAELGRAERPSGPSRPVSAGAG